MSVLAKTVLIGHNARICRVDRVSSAKKFSISLFNWLKELVQDARRLAAIKKELSNLYFGDRPEPLESSLLPSKPKFRLEKSQNYSQAHLVKMASLHTVPINPPDSELDVFHSVATSHVRTEESMDYDLVFIVDFVDQFMQINSYQINLCEYFDVLPMLSDDELIARCGYSQWPSKMTIAVTQVFAEHTLDESYVPSVIYEQPPRIDCAADEAIRNSAWLSLMEPETVAENAEEGTQP